MNKKISPGPHKILEAAGPPRTPPGVIPDSGWERGPPGPGGAAALLS